MALYTSYDQIGKAEDVSSVITDITPTKTPFLSSLGDDKVTARSFDWQEDALRAVQVNAQLEGFTASDATLTATTLRTNYTQILEKTIKVSTTSDVIKTHGRAKETAYQLARAGEEVKRDLENAMVGIAQAAVAGAAGVARKFTSALNQIAAANTTAGGTAAITEAKILATHQLCYNAGAEPTVLMIKPADSLIVNTFAAATGRTRDLGGDKKFVNVIDVYVSPFGSLKITMNRFLKTTHAILYDPADWKRCVLRNWSRTMLAKTGDNEMHMLVGEFSLKHNNQLSSGMIDALT
jgi:hypothetical protein